MKRKIHKLFIRGGQLENTLEITKEERLHNFILTYFCLSTELAGFIWGYIYWLGGSFLPGCNPMGYGIFSVLNLLIFLWTKNVKIFRFTQINRGKIAVKGKGEMETWFVDELISS